MRENKLQRDCLDWLGEHHPRDVLPVNIHGGGWSAKGFPDILCCIKGRFAAIELKVDGNGLQSGQRIWRSRIQGAGGLHFTARSVSEFAGIINTLLEAEGENE